MLVFVSYHVSGELLFNSLDIENKRYLFRPHLIETENRNYFLVRWGSRARCQYRPHYVLNQKKAIKNATHKFLTYQKFNEYGVIHPFSLYPPDFPCFAVMEKSERGKGVILVFSHADIRHLERLGYRIALYSMPIRIKKEYRIHITIDNDNFNYLILEKKRPRNINSFSFVIRNFENNYIFKYLSEDEIREITPLQYEAYKAIKSLNLDFGAVDCCIDDLGHNWIFEVNTAPGLRGESLTIDFYKDFIERKYYEWRDNQ